MDIYLTNKLRLGDCTVQIREPISKSFEKVLKEINIIEQRATPAAKPELSAYSFPGLYEGIGVDTNKLGCVMLDTEPIPVMEYSEGTEDDLYFKPDKESYMQGAVAEKYSHITILYGLMESGQTWRKQVNIVLKGWGVESLTITKVAFFDNPNHDCYCIVAHVKVTPELQEGNGRLRFLPHVDTFMSYKPHVTLAYIKKDEAILKRWVRNLARKLNGTTLTTTGLNYGD